MGNIVADIYFNLKFDEYKALEEAMKEFPETSHGEGTEYYHKAVRIPVGKNLTIEFHGPIVKARQIEEVKPDDRPIRTADPEKYGTFTEDN